MVTWIQYDKANRKEYIAQLVSNVRLALLPQEYLLQRVEEDNLVKTNNKCKVRTRTSKFQVHIRVHNADGVLVHITLVCKHVVL